MKRLYIAASISFAMLLGMAQMPANALLAVRTPVAHAMGPSPDKIANSAKNVACQLNTVGWCYRGVKQALNRVGIALSGTAAWMAKSQLSKDPRFKMVPMQTLRKGDILVHGKSGEHPYGHIAVYLGNNQEASDHVQKLVTGGNYGQTVVFRPVCAPGDDHCKRVVASIAEHHSYARSTTRTAPPIRGRHTTRTSQAALPSYARSNSLRRRSRMAPPHRSRLANRPQGRLTPQRHARRAMTVATTHRRHRARY